MKISLYILLTILIIPFQSFSQYGNRPETSPQKYQIGIEGDKMDQIMVAQNNSYWCWAATIEMVLNYYGLFVPQDSIVKEVYGFDENDDLPDYGATLDIINKELNSFNVDTNGVYYSISSKMGNGAPNPSVLIRELSKKKPVIIGYETGEGGHTVIITEVVYIKTERGPKILSITVRDPMPDAAFDMNNGKIEYPGKFLAVKIQAYWIVDVEKY
ncbi:MAG: C39 family peptidase [Bacteroidales bacterium]|nr:C39 family peptidase [Bacteroidales bacterium]